MADSLLNFSQVNDAAAATPSKLQKQSILADYFRSLDDANLRLAVRFSAGRAFPATGGRVLNVGGRVVSDVVLDLLRTEPREFHELVVRSGEIGEAISRIWPNPVPIDALVTDVTLLDVANAFDDLAATGNAVRKRDILSGLLRRARTGREAAYITKIISGDLRTGVQEGVLQAAVSKAFDVSLAAVQRCQLLVGDLEEVAVMARQGTMASAAFRLFHPVQFMLANPQETPADASATLSGRSFYCEDKLDGIRAQIHKSGEGADAQVAIYTRTMDRTDEAFPDVVAAVAKLPGSFLLDGEIVPWRDGVVLPFANIQKRLGRKVLPPRIIRDHPVVFIAFDLLYLDGALLMDAPLHARRHALHEFAQATGLHITTVSDVTSVESITAAFESARERRNEGIVLKDPEPPYSPGRRGNLWLKLKTHLPTIDCVVTAAEYGHGKRRDSLSDYTFGVWNRDPADPDAALVNIGKAFSGVTDEEIGRLTELFLSIAREKRGRAFLVEPRVVLEIACDQIQKSNRHASGFALRFPRIKRVRWDKRPQDADRLSRVDEIFQSTSNFALGSAAEAVAPSEPTLFDGLF